MGNGRNHGYSIGVDIGGTKINIGLIGMDGDVVAKNRINTDPEKGYEHIINNISNRIAKMLEAERIPLSKVRSVGFGVPGTTDPKNGKVVFAPNIGWRDLPFLELINKRLDIESYIGQDTQAAALAELLFGSGRGCENIVCITLGTGVGCGIIINKKIYRGGLNTSGELGHTIVKPKGEKCNCGRQGCLEAYASGPAIVRRAKKLVVNRKDHIRNELTTQNVFDMARNGNGSAKKIIGDAVEFLGMGLVNILNILSPEKIIISGGMCKENELLIEPVKRFVNDRGYPLAAGKVGIEIAKLGEDAPMIGAAMFFRDGQLSDNDDKG